MEKFNNICKKIRTCAWEIVKIACAILCLLLLGKLIVMLIISFAPYKPFSPFEQPDWNPVATIVGAVLTLTGTCIAVVWTAKLDIKARKEDKKYENYISLLIDIDSEMSYLKEVLERFHIHKNIPMNYEHRRADIPQEVEKTYKIYKTVRKLELINKNWFKKQYNEPINEIYKLQNAFNIEFFNVTKFDSYESKVFKIEQDKKVYYSLTEFLKAYKENTNIDFDADKISKDLDNIQNMINEEFKLEEK